MAKAHISGRQLVLLMVGSITVMGHLYMVPIVFGMAGRDSWLCIMVTLAVSLILTQILTGLAGSTPGQSLVEIACDLLGKPLGKSVGLVYTGYFLLVPAITIRGLMDFMTTAFMPATPPLAFGFLFLFICAYAVLGGLERLVRTNELLLPLLIIMGILAAGLTSPFKDYRQLLPVLEDGIGPVLRGSVPLIGLTGELVVIGMIQPAVKSPQSLWKYNMTAMLIIALLFVGPLTGPIAMFGVGVAAQMHYPTFSEIEQIRLGGFLENLQVLSVSLWLFGSFGRVSLFYYASAKSASQFLGLSEYRKLVAPFGIIILVLAIVLFPDDLMVRNFLTGVYPHISIGLGIIFPAVLLAVAAARNYHRGPLR